MKIILWTALIAITVPLLGPIRARAQTNLPHVPTEAQLAASATATYPSGVVLDDYASGLGAGPLQYQPLTLTCSANGYVNDGGSCINDTSGDGNSWLAKPLNSTMDVLSFGARGDAKLIWSTANAITTTSGSPNLSVSGVTFTSADINKLVALPGAGTGGAPFLTTISNVSGGNAVLTANVPNGGHPQFTVGLQVETAGTLCVPGDVLSFTNGVYSAPTKGTVLACKAVGMSTVAAAGSGGTPSGANGTIAYGTTGNGIRVVLNVTISSGGALTAVNSIVDGGNYTSNPTSLAAEPIDGVGVPSGAKVVLAMGVATINPATQPGVYSSYPTTAGCTFSATFCSYSTTGSEAGFSAIGWGEYTNGTLIYSTDDGPALQAALNWAGTNGASLSLPSRMFGIGETIDETGNSSTVQGKGGRLDPTVYYAASGSIIQWIGSVGGNVLVWGPTPGAAAISASNNKLAGVSIQCGIPINSGLFGGEAQPVAAYGLQVLSERTIIIDQVQTQECSTAGLYTSAIAVGMMGSNLDTIGGTFTNLSHENMLPADGYGYWLGGNSHGDTDYAHFDNISGVYMGAPSMRVQSIDNNYLNRLHFAPRPNSAWAYGLDITADLNGCSGACPDQSTTLTVDGVSTTSIVRGEEASAAPPEKIYLRTFDYGNSVPVVVARGTGEDAYYDLPLITAWYPVLTYSGGAAVSWTQVAAQYSRVGKQVCYSLTGYLTYTAAPNYLYFTLPSLPEGNAQGLAWETNTGHTFLASMNQGYTMGMFVNGSVSSADYINILNACYAAY